MLEDYWPKNLLNKDCLLVSFFNISTHQDRKKNKKNTHLTSCVTDFLCSSVTTYLEGSCKKKKRFPPHSHLINHFLYLNQREAVMLWTIQESKKVTKRKTLKHEIQLILTALGTGDVHEKRGKNIHIMPEIEVPPVIIKSTVGSERLERLIMLSTAFQQP